MNLKNFFLLCLIAMPAMGFCQKNTVQNQSPALKTQTDVYVAGSIVADGGSVAAAYWKNGVCTKLSDSVLLSYASGIAVGANGDVHVSENYSLGNGKSIPVYWKNGVEKKLPYEGYSEATATGIAVNANGDVYISGYTIDTNSQRTAVYWKNGQEATALAPGVFSEADAVAINETGVYFAGSSMTSAGKLQIVYWKDGIVTNLSKDLSIVNGITGIALKGAEVYTAGTIVKPSLNYSAVYWKNKSEAMPLKSSQLNSYADAITVNNNDDIYVAGYTDNGTSKTVATYRKNGTSINLTDGANANAIALGADDVYIAGTTTDYKAAYWKNGAITYLAGGIEAKGIVVVTHQ